MIKNVIKRTSFDYPDQRVPESKKTIRFKQDSLDFVIQHCINSDISREEIDMNYNVILGQINIKDYNYILNPYGSNDSKLKNFPAKLRNVDITSDIFRRYMGEYESKPHEFVVRTNDSDYSNRKMESIKSKIDNELDIRLNNAIVDEMGLDPNLKATESKEQDFSKFVNRKEMTYEDALAISGQKYLNAIVSGTESEKLYVEAYSDWITCGRAISYREINHDDIDKEIVPPREYYRPTSKNMFIEDDEMGCRLQYMTLTQIDTKFKMSKADRDYLTDILSKSVGDEAVYTSLTRFRSRQDGRDYPTFFNNNHGSNAYIKFSESNKVFPVYHAFWQTQKQIAYLTYLDDNDVEQEMIVPADYKLDLEIGDIKLEKDYIVSYMEGWRIGNEDAGIYLDMDYCKVQRDDLNDKNEVKAPYNGITNIVGSYRFALGEILAPYQTIYNIFYYHRERLLARNDGNLLVIPEGLIGDSDTFSSDERLYYAKADGKLYIDDTHPNISVLVQAIKHLETSDYNLIASLSDLIAKTKEEAREAVDMNRQRYGDILTTAGKSTTEQAIIKSSIGSYPILRKFEWFIERDYNADLDYSKIAWKKGKKGTYITTDFDVVAYEVDPEEHMNASYDVHVKSSNDEEQVLQAYKELAFSAAQNGQFAIAAKAIRSKNAAQLETLIEAYQAKLDEQQKNAQESSERIAQAAQQFQAQTKAQEMELKKYGIDKDYAKAIEVKLLDIQNRYNNGENVQADLAKITADVQTRINDNSKMQYQKQRDAEKDALKREEMANNKYIASINKN